MPDKLSTDTEVCEDNEVYSDEELTDECTCYDVDDCDCECNCDEATCGCEEEEQQIASHKV